jgi:uncharacterized protein with HEPN domain
MPPPDAVFLGHMLDALDRIAELVARTDQEAFDSEWVVQDALIRELEVLGEAAAASLHRSNPPDDPAGSGA